MAWYKDGVYYCTECRFPRCSGCGKARPAKSSRLHQRFQEYLCEECQTDKQKCTECNTYKLITEFDKRSSRNRYDRCRACQHPPCSVCLQPITTIWDRNTFDKPFCSDLCRGVLLNENTKECKQCKLAKALTEFDVGADSRVYKICRECQHPPCSQCGRIIETIWIAHPKAKDRRPVCFRKTCRKKMSK